MLRHASLSLWGSVRADVPALARGDQHIDLVLVSVLAHIDTTLAGVAELAEISGSDTFVHLSTPLGAVVAQLVGVHYFELGAAVTMYFSPQDVYLFDAQGALLRAPVDVQRGAAREGA